MAKVLMIEDDLEITELLETYLLRYNIILDSVVKPSLAKEKLQDIKYDLILLDLGLPEIDGLDFCKELKSSHPDTPIIISTARADVADKVIAFENGADDYVAKPYEPRELVARIEALIRRYKKVINKEQKPKGPFFVDKNSMQIFKDGVPLKLTLAEYEIFSLLLEKSNQVVSREMIVHSTNSLRWDSSDRSIDVIISRIRQKINDNPKNPKYIRSVRGIGYKYIGE
jgi:two-component system OmpR family response regulator